MKVKNLNKMIPVFLLTFAVLSFGLAGLQLQADTQGEKGKITEANFNVEGMTCGLCPISVTTALKKLDGVVDAKASYEEKSAWAKYDEEKVNVSKLIDAINGLGFKASLKK